MVANGRDRLLVCVTAAGHHLCRVGRDDEQQEEGDERHADQDQHRLQETLQNVGQPSIVALLGRIEDVAERVADEIEGKRQQQNCRARE